MLRSTTLESISIQLFWLTRDSFSRSQGSRASTSGRLRAWRTARRSSAGRPRISLSIRYSAAMRTSASAAIGAARPFSFSDAELDAEWGMIYGYARVSTDAQDLSIQLDLLRAAGCEKVFHDKEAGDSADRHQLKRLMKKLSAGDVVKAPATDRFARDPTDLLVLGRDIRAKGARFVSIAEPIVDTDSEFWELVAACFGIAAKFELRRIRERTAAGRAAAKAQGVKFGRKPKLTPHQKREALRRRDVDRENHRSIARSSNVSQSPISRLRP